ncbi:TIGR01841 family phasin [Cupriavidus sp. U2]|uniref:TIGR01841 family phasin n=1 Tax=Cupriavidus sp. U2 TaxID=2920269 RepID=UPI001E5ABF18|nr:TIGR01841 family phasin [Cupriavidus sp. U2]
METTASKSSPAHPAAALFSAYTGVLQRLGLPGLDVSAIAEARRKDLAALAAIHLALLDGVQAFSQKQAEVVRGTLSGLQDRLMQSGVAGNGAATGAVELTQGALQKSLANLRDLADIAQKTQADSVSAASKRIAENVEELKALFKPAQ